MCISDIVIGARRNDLVSSHHRSIVVVVVVVAALLAAKPTVRRRQIVAAQHTTTIASVIVGSIAGCSAVAIAIKIVLVLLRACFGPPLFAPTRQPVLHLGARQTRHIHHCQQTFGSDFDTFFGEVKKNLLRRRKTNASLSFLFISVYLVYYILL